jgi:hypothetical protein
VCGTSGDRSPVSTHKRFVCLGHSLEFIESKDELNASLSQDFDLIYTDYNTVGFIREQVADGEKWFRTNKCKLRILDCFGTEPEFNDHKLTQPKPYCCLGALS